MKQIKFIFRNVLFPASFFFTLFNIFAYLVEFADTGSSVKIVNFSLILLYFVVVALANNVFKAEMSMLAKVTIHYLAILLPLFGLVAIIGNSNAIGGIFIVITIVYALFATPILLVRHALHRKDNEEQKYDSQFK